MKEYRDEIVSLRKTVNELMETIESEAPKSDARDDVVNELDSIYSDLGDILVIIDSHK